MPLQFEPLADQFTPALSLVVAVTDRAWLMTMPARLGEREREAWETMVRVKFTEVLWEGELESVTLKVSGVAFVVMAGVPVIAPLDVFKDRFAGREPLVRDHV